MLASDASNRDENLDDDRPFPSITTTTGTYAVFDRIKQLAYSPGGDAESHLAADGAPTIRSATSLAMRCRSVFGRRITLRPASRMRSR
ncbi:hypothetical protein [Kribbella sp. C-35]|uniref:hypothetical protein n=1 Tax=Kribbella sp. C-35 TaxID=2789276 RepID=UPI00397AD7FE